LQEVNLVLWRKAAEFDGRGEFLSWACRIAFLQVLAHRQEPRPSRFLPPDEVAALTPAERARVFDARARALRDLRVDLVSSPDPVSARVLGLPDATSALTLLALVEPTLAAA
jgi:DNA-directed RNA polymerase specialized sigma24 family protein